MGGHSPTVIKDPLLCHVVILLWDTCLSTSPNCQEEEESLESEEEDTLFLPGVEPTKEMVEDPEETRETQGGPVQRYLFP